MKKLFLLLMLVLGHTFGNSQSTDWKQIRTIRTLGVYLLYQSSNGFLIGNMVAYKKIAFSFDNGQNWNISQSIPTGLNGRNSIKESNSGKIYYFYESNVYVFDTEYSDFVKLINFPSYTEIDDIGIIYNGDLVIAAEGELFLYTNDGKLKNTYKINTGSAKILTSRDSIAKNYLIIKSDNLSNLHEFSNDLNFLGNNKSIKSYKLVRFKDRLISNQSYSNDGGLTWKSIRGLSQKKIKDMIVTYDNNIFAIGKNEVLISKDGGISFSSFDCGLNNIDYVSSSFNRVMVISNKENCNFKIYSSSDFGKNWTPTANKSEVFHTSELFAGINENLFTRDCNTLRKKGPNDDWKLLYNNEGQVNDLNPSIFHLSNFDIISQDILSIKKSKDNGNTWVDIKGRFSNSVNRNRLVEKKGVVYHLSSDSLHYSKDFGDTWQALSILKEALVHYIISIELTNNFDMYFWDFTTRFIIKYNFLTKKISNINLAQELQPLTDFATSFDGNQLYILSEKSNKIWEFFVTNNDGITFTKNSINLKESDDIYQLRTDHLGNVYIFSKSDLLISSNQGTTWQNITPKYHDLISINDIQVSYDNYIYLATTGKGILKYNFQLSDLK